MSSRCTTTRTWGVFFHSGNDQDGELLVSEINTIPGFTAISMYAKLWQASGLPFRELLHRLLDLALERHRTRPRGA